MFERCQFESSLYAYPWPIGALRTMRRALWRMADLARVPVALGAPSRYHENDWVRVRDTEAIRATLDERDALRGLAFTRSQWETCGDAFRVSAVVRRMMNDRGRMVKISRTVTLAEVYCDGEDHRGGCGRACPLLYRDEWLEPAEKPQSIRREGTRRFARVRDLSAINATLDRNRKRDGVSFVGEMAWHAGGRYAVRKRVDQPAVTPWRKPRGEWYVLEGARCHGMVLGDAGPCHRGCSLVWHRDWLEFEDGDGRT